MLAETPKAGGRFFRAAVVGPVLALALAPDQAGWARRPPDRAWRQPKLCRPGRGQPADLLSLFVCSRCMPTPVIGPCLSARERAGSLTHHQPRQSLAVPWRRRDLLNNRSTAHEGSRSWNARAASPSACYARPLVGSLRRASAGQRWTDPVRAAQRTGQLSVFREARPPSARRVVSQLPCAGCDTHGGRGETAHGSVIYNLVVRSMSSVAGHRPPRLGALRKNRYHQRHISIARSIAAGDASAVRVHILGYCPSSALR